MKRLIVTLIGSVAILALAFWGYQTYLAPVATPTPAPIAGGLETAEEIVSAEGVVSPARVVNLAFKLPGRVIEVNADEGGAVRQDDVMARLDATLVEKQVAQAETQVAIAETQLAQAQGQVEVAEKQLAQLQAGGTREQISAAQAAINAATANYNRVIQGPTREQLAGLKANVDNAQAALNQAQAAYDRAGGASNPFIAQTAEALALERATNAYQAALSAYNDALAHPTASEVAAANAQIQQAREALARLNATPEQIAVAQAQVNAAKRAVPVAQAQVNAARASLEAAEAQLSDYALMAPFAGTIATRNIEMGQIVQPGVPVFVLGDLAELEIETTDLAEVDAPRVRPGLKVRITSDSFPEKTYGGEVKAVAPLATDFRGDKVFRVTIAPDAEARADLRWGMTANVEIVLSE